MDLKELREKRGKVIADARAIHEKAEKEKRAMADDEREQWSKFMDESDGLKKQTDDAVRQQDADRSAAATQLENMAKPKDEKTLEERQMAGFEDFLKYNKGDQSAEAQTEFRAMQADLDVSGGYLAAPKMFVAELLKDVDNTHIIRQLARKFSLGQAVSLGVPSLDTRLSAAAWGTEIGTPAFDSSLVFGGRELNPHPANAAVKVSRDLMRVSTIPITDIVRDELAYDIGELEDNGFLTGSGSNQPLGVFTASSDGISTGQDVQTDNTTTDIRFDNLKRVKYKLNPKYRANATWLMHSDVVRNISLLKDGDGQYIWRASVVEGDPDRILNLPIAESDNAPSVFSGSGYMAVLGDFRYYWIADAYDFELQRLDELYAANNQVGFIARFKVDGMPVLEKAFVRSKLV